MAPEQKRREAGVQAGKFTRSVSLLAWGYNEEDLISGFLDRARALMEETVEDFEIVFIDDGSTDRTGGIVDACAAKDPRVRCLHNEENRNVGYACRRAISEARKEYLFWQTVDWSYDLSELRIFLELLTHFDVVQGVRPVPVRPLTHIPGIRSIYRLPTRSDSFRKAVVSLGNYYLIKILFGASFNDFQNVTFYRTDFIQNVPLVADSSFANPECLLKALAEGKTVIEVPIPFVPRKKGTAKGTRLRSILRSVRDIIKASLRWGWRVRLGNPGRTRRQVSRASEPHRLEPAVSALVEPLLKYHRPPSG